MVQIYAGRLQEAPAMTTFVEGEDLPIVAYVTAPDGTLLISTASQTGTVESGTVSVFDLDGSDPGTAIYTAALTISSVFTTTATTDGWWTLGSSGRNFKFILSPATSFTASDGHSYRVELAFITTNYGTVALDVIALCRGRL